LRVLVLEARDRLGGRIDTWHDPAWPAPIERGAEFIHGKPPETWDIVRAAGLPVHDFATAYFQSRAGSIVRHDDFSQQVGQVMQRISRLQEADLSWADFLARYCADVPQNVQELATAFIEGLNAADQKAISVKSLSGEGQTPQEQEQGLFRIVGGQDGLVQWLRAGIDPALVEFRYNTVATDIRWQPGEVAVETRSACGPWQETFQASCAVVTLPLGVLQAPPQSPGAVRFEPDLPAKRQAASQLRMGPVVKVIIRFQQAFWQGSDLDDLGFVYRIGAQFSPWWTLLPLRAPVLVGWAGGPAAAALVGRTQDDILQRALVDLAETFGNDPRQVVRLLESWQVCDWQADPFARGAYSYVAVGGIDAPRQLGLPVEQTLYFAGEATHAAALGTVAGALASGYRAASEILADRPLASQ
jgi:monoamine oxidase